MQILYGTSKIINKISLNSIKFMYYHSSIKHPPHSCKPMYMDNLPLTLIFIFVMHIHFDIASSTPPPHTVLIIADL